MSWFYTILSGVVSFLLSAWILFQISNRRVLRLCRDIPPAQPYYPVLGNILMLACSHQRMTENVMRALQEAALRGHRAVCFWIGPYPIIVVMDPVDIKKILMNSLSRGIEAEKCATGFMEYGLLTAPLHHWKVTRRHLNLSFHPRNLEHLIPTFNFASRKFVADLAPHIDGPEFNLMPRVMNAALRSISIFLYGPETMESVTIEQLKDLEHGMELAPQLMSVRFTRPFIHGIIFNSLWKKEINIVKNVRQLMSQVANLVLFEKSQSNIEERSVSNDQLKSTKYNFHTLYEAMLELQEKVPSVTDEHILDEMLSFLGTGTDSIGATVSSCLMAMARFPQVQDKVYEELRSVLSEYEEDITNLDLNRLTYLEKCVKETLRFFTTVPFTTRSPNKDIDLGGYVIPANKSTVLNVTASFNEPRHFPEPNKFDPERFSTSEGVQESVYIPFSRGPRNCLGSVYSMMLMKVMIAHVVRSYRLSTCNVEIQNVKKTFMITLPFSDGYYVSIRKRSD